MAALLHNGRFFQTTDRGKSHGFATCLLIGDDGLIGHVGDVADDAVKDALVSNPSLRQHDMADRVVLPGFIDGHMHLLMLGQSLRKADLGGCANLDDIRRVLKEHAAANPGLPRIMARGWMHSMTDGKALASMIDDIDSRPIFIDSKDLHSTWCNAAALEEMGVKDMADPEGGEIARDEKGAPSGLLSESAAVNIVWPHVATVAPMEEKLAALKSGIDAYMESGYTGVVDLAMDENIWEALQELRKRERLPMRFAAFWLITPRKNEADNLVQVDRAIELRKQFNQDNSPDCYIAGIKCICDGIIDGCTAALTEPYNTNGASPDLIWPLDLLAPVVRKADEANLQCALHAIGDLAIKTAIDALEHNTTTPGHRHRIEHLELASAADAARLGRLNITASIQPVHADPAILRAWPKLLGEHRCSRAFAYKEFSDGGAVLAVGSDAPTAPHAPLKNLYTVVTRRSAREPGLDVVVNANFALDLGCAVAAATEGVAWSCRADKVAGRLEKGLSADLAVCEMEWEGGKLLEGRVVETWFKGKRVFEE